MQSFTQYIQAFFLREYPLSQGTVESSHLCCTGRSSNFNYFPQMLASRLTAYFRKKCVVVTDRRVRLMNEILGSIKFIKMYCWESVFANNLQSESPHSDTNTNTGRSLSLYIHFLLSELSHLIVSIEIGGLSLWLFIHSHMNNLQFHNPLAWLCPFLVNQHLNVPRVQSFEINLQSI